MAAQSARALAMGWQDLDLVADTAAIEHAVVRMIYVGLLHEGTKSSAGGRRLRQLIDRQDRATRP